MNDVILSALYFFFKKISFSSKFHAEIPVEDISLLDPELRFACNGETKTILAKTVPVIATQSVEYTVDSR